MNQGGGGRLVRRALIVGVPVTALVAGWLLALAFVSPSQVAANTEPPADVPLWATVTTEHLKSTIMASGQVQSEGLSAVDLTRLDGRSVTAAYIELGDMIAPGAPVLELNGRPLLAMPGHFQYYRDIGEGMSGPDVKQLQQALNSAGAELTVDGVCGTDTLKALGSVYERAGYEPSTVLVESQQSKAKAESSGGGGSGDHQPDDDVEGAVQRTRKAIVMVMDEVAVVPPGNLSVVDTPTYGDVIGDDAMLNVASGGTHVVILETAIPGEVNIGDPADVLVNGATVHSDVSRETEITVDGEATSAYIVDLPDGTFEPGEQMDTAVSVVITVEDLGEEHLVVPAAAVSYGDGGSASIGVLNSDGSTVIVPVSVISTIEGRVAIKADGIDVSEGDKVLIGQ